MKAILILLVLLPIFSFAAEPVPTIRLALNWKPEPQFGGFYAAQAGDEFKKNNLKVEIKEGGSGTPTVQMIASGTVEFGIVSGDEVILSRSHGSDVVALFAVYQTNPQGIMVHEEKGYKGIADLFASRDTLALQKGLPYSLFLSRKYPKATVKMVPYLGGIANFLNDPSFSQQCFATSEPLAAKKAGAHPKTFLIAEEGYNPYTTVVATRASYLQKNPKVVQAMIASIRAGWTSYLAHPEAVNQLMHKMNPSMDLETFKASAATQKSLIATAETAKSGLGSMSEQRWSQLTQQIHELGLVEKAPPAAELFRNF